MPGKSKDPYTLCHAAGILGRLAGPCGIQRNSGLEILYKPFIILLRSARSRLTCIHTLMLSQREDKAILAVEDYHVESMSPTYNAIPCHAVEMEEMVSSAMRHLCNSGHEETI